MTSRTSRLSLLAITIAAACLFTPMHARAADEPKIVKGDVAEVTLYRGQAMVTRQVPVDAPKGSVEIAVTELPDQLVTDSLFAEGGEGVEVRAVRYRSRAVGEEPREEVRKLDEAIQVVADSLAQNQALQQVLGKRSAYLDQLETFVAGTGKSDLANGVLNAESLERLTLFSFEQRGAVLKEQLDLQKQQRELQEQVSLLQRQRAKLTQGVSRNVHEAVLFLQKTADGPQTVRLSYLVNNCGWQPSYNFRATNDGQAVRVEYNALIAQMTGEDWSNVSLTLSTASPALSAERPGLAAFQIALTSDPAQKQMQGGGSAQVLSQLKDITRRQSASQVANTNAVQLSDNLETAWGINEAAIDYQVLELICSADVLAMVRTQAPTMNVGPSFNYQLPNEVSLASRADQQMVRIVQTDLATKVYHVATPVLSTFVYREAQMTNTSGKDLLGGPVNVYLEGRFVGRGEIDTVARGQTFVIGFGADSQLRTRRELVQREDATQGGNQVLSFAYRLVLENYKDEPVTVRLYDRLPHAERSKDIRVNTSEMSDPLSQDTLYLRLEKPDGLLRWDVEVPAQASGEKAKIVTYSYTLEFDRSLSLTTPDRQQAQQYQAEFIEQQQRLKKQ